MLAQVTEWLIDASSEIGSNYFQLPVAGSEEPKYRERVYCYELYHRWRSHWPERSEHFRYSLGGEVDKSGHPLIRADSKPDFLIHVPRRMDNLLVIEVKPKNAGIHQMVGDLKKLTSFRRDLVDERRQPASYQAAYFWVYGISQQGWLQLKGQLLDETSEIEEVNTSLISCYIHESAGARAIPVDW